jgi:CxxC motif-containing protein (DUF1111 family)
VKRLATLIISLLSPITLLASVIDPSEKFPAGKGSTSDFSVQAFSHPLSGTRGEQRREFNVGNSFFQSVWVMSPASTTLRDGLGPTYNAVSCTSCHFKDGRGRGLPDEDGKIDVSLLIRLRVKDGPIVVGAHPAYGGQFKPFAIDNVVAPGDVMVRYETITGQYADGETYELKKPNYHFENLAYGPMGKNTIISPRVGPQMIGLGLIEAIKEEDILTKEDPDDLDGDGISGKANRVFSVVHQDKRVGRFGWKAEQPSLIEQNAAAFNGDIGITSPLFPEEECPTPQITCIQNRTQEDISLELLEKVTTYTQLLAVPQRRNFEDPRVQAGRNVFYKVNCQACHTPSYITGNDAPFEVLRNQTIYPYSDFLLHDMGDMLADDKEELLHEALATTREWRTPPLWGLGLTQTVNKHTRYLHDGRARNLEEAILWHGGEAEKSKQAFMKLPKKDREELIEFLKSL